MTFARKQSRTGTYVEEICRKMGISGYFLQMEIRPGNTHLRLRIRDIVLTRVRYGFGRIFILLKREGFTDNHKRVYRGYLKEGLNLRSKRPLEKPYCFSPL